MLKINNTKQLQLQTSRAASVQFKIFLKVFDHNDLRFEAITAINVTPNVYIMILLNYIKSK